MITKNSSKPWARVRLQRSNSIQSLKQPMAEANLPDLQLYESFYFWLLFRSNSLINTYFIT